MNYIAGSDRGEALLLPEVLDDGQLDLSKAGFTNAELKETGRPRYDPGDLLRLYLCGYLNRVRSSRGLEREVARNLELIWVLRRLWSACRALADCRSDKC